jgi:hypothetical protein
VAGGVMSDDRPIKELREAAGDLHHGMRQEKARGDADALAHIRSRAEQAGASDEQLTQITSGFVAIAQELLDQQAPQRRRLPLHRLRRRKRAANLPPAKAPKQLPPGSEATP